MSTSAREKTGSIFKVVLSLLTYLLIGFILLYLGVTFWQSRQRRLELRNQLNQYEQRLEHLRQRKRVLIRKNQLLTDNEHAVEYYLRERYGLLEPDEYRIVKEPSSEN